MGLDGSADLTLQITYDMRRSVAKISIGRPDSQARAK